jgi:hypothetical protein
MALRVFSLRGRPVARFVVRFVDRFDDPDARTLFALKTNHSHLNNPRTRPKEWTRLHLPVTTLQ